VFSTVHGSAQGADMNRWCRCLEYLGEYAEVSQCMSFVVCSAVHRVLVLRVANPGGEKLAREASWIHAGKFAKQIELAFLYDVDWIGMEK
jgi:hypothetical protein